MKAALKDLRPAPRSHAMGFVLGRLRVSFPRNRNRTGSILVGLLWCLAILSVVVVAVLHTSRMDLQVVKNYGDRIQAHYLALAGIEKAKALLYQDARERSRSARNHSGNLYDAPDQFRNITFGRGKFSVLRRGRPDEGGGITFGVSDEESRLNVNTAPAEALTKLYGITPDVVAAMVDWRDEDNTVTPSGAEADYYMALQPPYMPRNGPVQTLRELLMVRGVTRDALFQNDSHVDGMVSQPADEPSRQVVSDLRDLGWAGMLTVNSAVDNLNAGGNDRVDLQSADETTLTGVKGITSDIAKAIIAYRGQNRFQSLADLLDVPQARNQDNTANQANQLRPVGGRPGQQNQNPAANNAANAGPKVINDSLFMDIADDLCVGGDSESPGLININTASLEVLASLPGVSRELAQAIISYRQSSGFLANIAYLLKVQGLTRDIFKQVAPLVTARSETYRILGEGKVTSTGARQRIMEVVHIGLQKVTTVSYREDDL
jgi:competence ComEA-like helix-hairpin-helix protein